MKRRSFITGVGALAFGWPSRARVQPVVRTIGLWWSPLQIAETFPRYKRRLAELGWVDEDNLRVRVRSWEGDTSAMRQQADELLAAQADLIVVASNPAVAILKPLDTRTPIVFVFVADPVGSGFVESLARPGGNITGFTNFEPAMGGKWLEVLREVAPATTRVMVLMHPETNAHKEFWRAIEQVADPLHIEAVPAGVHNAAEIERAVAEFGINRQGGVIALPHPVMGGAALPHHSTGDFAPLASGLYRAAHASAGALVTYGIDLTDAMLQTTEYVDRIRTRDQTGGPAGSSTENVRAGGEPQDSENPWPHYFTDAAGSRRQSDRMMFDQFCLWHL